MSDDSTPRESHSPTSSSEEGVWGEHEDPKVMVEDDFHDPESAESAVILNHDETEEHEPVEEEETPPEKNKGRGPLVAGVVLLGIVALALLGYFQFFGGESSPPPPSPPTATVSPPKSGTSVNETATEFPGAGGSQGLSPEDVAALYNTGRDKASSPTHAPANKTDGTSLDAALGHPSGEPLPPASPESGAVVPGDLTSLTPASSPPSGGSANGPTVPGQGTASTGGASSVAAVLPSAAEQRLSTVEARLSTIALTQEETGRKLDALVQRLEAGLGSDSPGANPIGLVERVGLLEQKLALSKSRTVKPSKDIAAWEPSSEARHRTKTVHTSKHAKASKKPAVAKTAKSTAWVLRGAIPGTAWVAESSTSENLHRIGVGETLPGLGRITDVRSVGGRWEVVGTAKTLR